MPPKTLNRPAQSRDAAETSRTDTSTLSERRREASRTSPPPRKLPTARGQLLLITGEVGMWKTSIAAQFPKPCQFICDEQDQGVIDLVSNGQLDPEGLILPDISGKDGCEPVRHTKGGYLRMSKYLDAMIANLTDGMKPGDVHTADDVRYTMPSTMVFESIAGFEAGVHDYVCEVVYKGNRDHFNNYAQGATAAAKKEWPKFLHRLGILRQLGIHVIINGHTTSTTDGSMVIDHPIQVPDCSKKTYAVLAKDANLSAQLVLVPNYVNVNKEGKGKVEREGTRTFMSTPSPQYKQLKNHFGIRGDIRMESPEQFYREFCRQGNRDPKTFNRKVA